ncbi:MAG: FecR domain-containing protein [Verrucomicrobiales bacterium]|nr:FecR domain-containing protein [Verrucomicrobiales bacterium]
MNPTLFRSFLIVTTLFAIFSTLSEAAPESGRVTVAVGEVVALSKEGGAETPLEKGDKVAVGTTIKTGADARAVIVITPRSAIRISENSEVVIETVDEAASPKQVMIDLKDGSLGALLKPNASGELDFKVRTPSGVAAARGTFYSVAVKDGKGYAQVKEGRVEIIPAAEEN